MLLRYLTEGFLLGLSTGYVCLATCGPIYAPFLLERRHTWKGSLFALAKLSLGRFLTYALFGIVAGFLGRQITDFNKSYFTAIAYCVFSVLLVLSAFRANRREKGCMLPAWSRFADSPFILGVATGINFCPSFLIALTRAVDCSGPLSGGVLFSGFFIGTSVFLLPLFIFGVLGNKRLLRIAGQVSALLVGTWFITQAVLVFIHAAAPIPRDKGAPNEIVTLLDSTKATLLTTDTASFALLKSALAKNRPGQVAFATDTPGADGAPYVFVDRNWPARTAVSFAALKRPGRFVFVLPSSAGSIDASYCDRLIGFLKNYSFKKPAHGAVLFSPQRIEPPDTARPPLVSPMPAR
jgi:sulfite exporter TauE/SafE